jgi:hypothetical protein
METLEPQIHRLRSGRVNLSLEIRTVLMHVEQDRQQQVLLVAENETEEEAITDPHDYVKLTHKVRDIMQDHPLLGRIPFTVRSVYRGPHGMEMKQLTFAQKATPTKP